MKLIDVQELVFETLLEKKMKLKVQKHLHKIPQHQVEEADYKINILNYVLNMMMAGKIWIEMEKDELKEEEK